MIPVLLTKIKTRDGITLDGIYLPPRGKKRYALIWIHGLLSQFSSGQTLIKELSSRTAREGIGYFKFNNRGYGIVARGGKHLIGSAYEKFEDCVFDIRVAIGYAKQLGYRNIILAGHSTGANKVLHYIYKTRDTRVKKIILLGPINDIAAEESRIGKKKLAQTLAYAKRLYHKDPHALIIQKDRLYTAARYISLCEASRAEDTFPYNNPRAEWKQLRSVKIPLAVFIGSRDEYLDRPAKNLIEIFKNNAARTASFSGIIIKNAGHSFVKKEKELAQKIMEWIKRAIA